MGIEQQNLRLCKAKFGMWWNNFEIVSLHAPTTLAVELLRASGEEGNWVWRSGKQGNDQMTGEGLCLYLYHERYNLKDGLGVLQPPYN